MNFGRSAEVCCQELGQKGVSGGTLKSAEFLPGIRGCAGSIAGVTSLRLDRGVGAGVSTLICQAR